ncbi:MAG: hypothetical protein GTO16_08600 [Candidatus Aminicenantes bacterium]|nr:hypothetical protein [Candidatus Aminicenantes bacterium]
MKKLTVALVIVMLLTLPVVGLADSPNSQGNPRKPGTGTNPGLIWAAFVGYLNSGNWFGDFLTDWLWFYGTPAWPSGK